MSLELLSKEDLQQLKQELLSAVDAKLNTLIEQARKTRMEQWLTVGQLKEKLDISVGKLRYLRVRGEIPYSQLGSTIYYPFHEILQILEQNKKQQTHEPNGHH